MSQHHLSALPKSLQFLSHSSINAITKFFRRIIHSDTMQHHYTRPILNSFNYLLPVACCPPLVLTYLSSVIRQTKVYKIKQKFFNGRILIQARARFYALLLQWQAIKPDHAWAEGLLLAAVGFIYLTQYFCIVYYTVSSSHYSATPLQNQYNTLKSVNSCNESLI